MNSAPYNNGPRFFGRTPRGNGRFPLGRGPPPNAQLPHVSAGLAIGPPQRAARGRGPPVTGGSMVPSHQPMMQGRGPIRGRGPLIQRPTIAPRALPPSQMRGQAMRPPPPTMNSAHVMNRPPHRGLPPMGRGPPLPASNRGLPPPPPPPSGLGPLRPLGTTPHAPVIRPPALHPPQRLPIPPPMHIAPVRSQLGTAAQVQSQNFSAIGPQNLAATSKIPVVPNIALDIAELGTKEQIDKSWTTYTPKGGGRTYYYNTITKLSTYEKPGALNNEAESVQPVAQQQPGPWREYIDAGSGKKYYSNGVTTSWEPPEEFKPKLSISEKPSQPPVKKRKLSTTGRETDFRNSEEAVAAFKGLLLAKEVTPAMKWSDVVKVCSPDPRWAACEHALTIGERKQSMAEYQTKRANELRTLERQEKARVKDSFMQLLSDMLPSLASFSVQTTRFADVRDNLAKDDRFHAVADEDTRESLFLDFCEETKKREQRKKRDKRRDVKDSFHTFLQEKQEDGKLTFASTWSSFVLELSDQDKGDPRFATSAVLADSERQLYFADYVIELQAAEDDRRRRMSAAKERAESAQREAFLKDLSRLASSGKITPSSEWRTVETMVLQLPSCGPVRCQDGTSPRNLFQSFAANWSIVYRQERTLLEELVGRNSREMPLSGMNQEDFEKYLVEKAGTGSSPEYGTRLSGVIQRNYPASSVGLYLRELKGEYQGLSNGTVRRRSGAFQQKNHTDGGASSEDEGEIVE